MLMRNRRLARVPLSSEQLAMFEARIRRESDAAKAMFGIYACGARALLPSPDAQTDKRALACTECNPVHGLALKSMPRQAECERSRPETGTGNVVVVGHRVRVV